MTGASTLTAEEVDELRRAAAVGPLPQDVVRRVLEGHERVQRERAELVATLERLAPAWRELRTVLNGLIGLLSAGSAVLGGLDAASVSQYGSLPRECAWQDGRWGRLGSRAPL